MAIRVVTPGSTWELVDPCLTTWEGAELARWLSAAAMMSDGLAPFTLTQPNLTVGAEPRAG